MGAATETRTPTIAAGRTAKSLRPARTIERAATLRLAATLLTKSGQRQAWLELDQVHAHRCAPRVRSASFRREGLRSCDSELRFGANQEPK
jgi:hypothetical protein